MRLTLFGLILATFLIPTSVQGQSEEKTQVTVSGFGVSAAAAEKDALMRAVRSAVGAYVDSETLIRNDELIREQILEASGSYVADYDMVGEPTQRSDGLWEVEIQAVVKGGQVAERLVSINVVEAGVDTKGRAGEIFTKTKLASEGAEILQKKFPRELMSQLLVARLIDKQGKATTGIAPQTQILPDGRVVATWYVEIYFDAATFYEKTVPDLDRVLSGIASKSGGPVVSVGEQVGALQGTGYPIFKGRKWGGATPTAPQGDQQYLYFFLSTGRSEKGGSERWQWYLLEGSTYMKLFTECNFAALWSQTILNIDMLAKDGGVVWSDVTSPFEESLTTNSYGFTQSETYVPGFLTPDNTLESPMDANVILTPRFGDSYTTSRMYYYPAREWCPGFARGHSDTIVKQFQVTLAPEDLRRISQVRLHFSPGKPLE